MKDWVKAYLNEKAIDKIEQSIKDAEERTSGEIVPLIVRRSSTVGHIPIVLF